MFRERKYKKENMKRKKKLYKNLSQDEKRIMKENEKQKQKEFIKKKREEFKKLSKAEQQKIKDKLNKNKHIKFPYLDEVDENTLKNVINSNKVYVDPGKRTLLVMMDDNGKVLTYTNKQKIYETKQLKYQRLLCNYKKKNGILEIEQNFDLNSKTCYIGKFKKYIKEKNKLNNKFRRYKWYNYINKIRSRDKLLNKIGETFGKKCKLIYGDWGEHKNFRQMRNFISTPNIGLKRKISKKYEIYNIDEFRTSILNHKTEEKCKNLYLQDKNGIPRKLHAVLTYKMENNRYGCINRDINAVKNMKKITDYWLKYKKRPEKYRRDYKLKEPNPRKKVSSRFHARKGSILRFAKKDTNKTKT